jgi:hypothetical protein
MVCVCYSCKTGIRLGAYLAKFVIKTRAEKKKLSGSQRNALNVELTPLIGFVFIFINAVVVLIVAIGEASSNNDAFKESSCYTIYALVILSQFFFLAPISDYYIFIRFSIKLEDYAKIKIYRLRS